MQNCADYSEITPRLPRKKVRKQRYGCRHPVDAASSPRFSPFSFPVSNFPLRTNLIWQNRKVVLGCSIPLCVYRTFYHRVHRAHRVGVYALYARIPLCGSLWLSVVIKASHASSIWPIQGTPLSFQWQICGYATPCLPAGRRSYVAGPSSEGLLTPESPTFFQASCFRELQILFITETYWRPVVRA